MKSRVRGVAGMVISVAVVGVCCSTPSYAHPGVGGCVDQVVMCGRWAATGWCQTRPRYMQENCPVSCSLCAGGGGGGVGGCADQVVMCRRWAATGWCQSRPQYMQENCPVSCSLCPGGGGGGGCVNQVEMCDNWAATGWCQTRLQYMRENCPVSCSLCGGGGGGGCMDQVVMCGRWAATGWCQTRFQYMQENCPVSCSLCIGKPECADSSSRCESLARRGDCVGSQREQVLALCPSSCRSCGTLGTLVDVRKHHTPGLPPGASRSTPTPPTPGGKRTITNPDFVCGEGYPASSSNFGDDASGTTQGATDDGSDAIMMIPGKVNMMVEWRTNNISVEDTFCGATPITDSFLLTAAHCVIDPEFPVRMVRLGEIDFAKNNEANSMPVDYKVERIIIHPEFVPTSIVRYNDLALIKTARKMAFNEVVFPYCLSASRPALKSVVTTAGFGLYNATYRSSRLKERELELVDLAACEEAYRREDLENHLKLRYPQLLQNRDILCATHPRRDACEGDSGGPLFMYERGRRFLVGVVGSGVSCRSSGVSILPGLYINVADHIDFIDSVVYGTTE